MMIVEPGAAKNSVRWHLYYSRVGIIPPPVDSPDAESCNYPLAFEHQQPCSQIERLRIIEGIDSRTTTAVTSTVNYLE